MDTVIASQALQIERKHFVIELRENPRGRFLRITEEAHGRRNTVIVPGTGLNDFMAAADAVCTAGNQVPFVPSDEPEPPAAP
ncbi:MAG TPA: DNA-binding protein [Chthoniobacteraceae bacterium]|jgi:hypothetical protein|nr:DNA-binding protein [Chthoniobacteraceae bacterium]